ncbi:hypothetical protein AcW1_009870 [Taiwanofungus camphoratus]|nr:hypothetical protein AcW1_009870 [Antrodia cinnamomea]
MHSRGLTDAAKDLRPDPFTGRLVARTGHPSVRPRALVYAPDLSAVAGHVLTQIWCPAMRARGDVLRSDSTAYPTRATRVQRTENVGMEQGSFSVVCFCRSKLRPKRPYFTGYSLDERNS